MIRDTLHERAVTRLAARSECDPEPLIDLAEKRADAASGIIVRERSTEEWRREVLEELADARNYLLWYLKAVQDGHVDGDEVAIGLCLHHVIAAWEELR